jgi:hypothetical protein
MLHSPVVTPPSVAQIITELLADLRAAPLGEGWRVERAATERLAALGDPAVPDLIVHLEQFEVDEYHASEEEACLRALVTIGTREALDYVVSRASRVMAVPEADGVDGQVGVIAIDALEKSTDPAVHEQLVQWTLRLGDGEGWDLGVIWHLLDAARPYLDERAIPILELLAGHQDIQDIAPSARRALREVRSKLSG